MVSTPPIAVTIAPVAPLSPAVPTAAAPSATATASPATRDKDSTAQVGSSYDLEFRFSSHLCQLWLICN